MSQNNVLLEVKKLRKYFPLTKGFSKRVIGTVKAVDEINFFIRRGETLSLVGESGSGKTTTGRCILRAIEPTSGNIFYRMRGEEAPVNIVDLERKGLKQLSKEMTMIFQDPYSSLNPRMVIRDIVGEPFIIHKVLSSKKKLEDKVANLLEMVRLDPDYMKRYPHAFSGGQRQRIAIARALALNPEFVIADEPVSALDVSVQAQILNLMIELQQELNLTLLFIAHDLSVVEYISDRIAVMYVGKIIELADAEEILTAPKHPYTESLLSAIPRVDPTYEKKDVIIKGEIADPANPPLGCHYHPRCMYAGDICRTEAPAFLNLSNDDNSPHFVSCHFANKLMLGGITKINS